MNSYAPALLRCLVLAALLAVPTRGEAYYGVGYAGLAAPSSGPGLQAGDTIYNGPTTLCTPAGTGPCGTLVRDSTAFSFASIPQGSLLVDGTGVYGSGWAFALINGSVLGLTGDDPGPGQDVILHVTYGWTITGAGSARFAGQGSGVFNPPTSVDTGNRPASLSDTHIDLIANVASADGYSFQFILDLGGTAYADAASEVHAHVSFWLELPEGGTLSETNYAGGVPLADAEAIPAPAALPVFLIGILALAQARRSRTR